ncbi:Hpt domain-containing protein [bacterium AH-315-F18]|nr:Hpt domain-containing protein [bacterium AH-315-F18]
MRSLSGDLPMHQLAHMDHTALTRLYELGGIGLVDEILEYFYDVGAQRVDRVKRAWTVGDLLTIERETHALRSSALNVGAVALNDVATEIETRARRGHREGIPELITELAAAYGDVLIHLHRSQSDMRP